MMKTPFTRECIAENVYFGSVKDSRYKTNLLSVYLILPLEEDAMTENALVSLMLEKGYEDYPTFKEFSKKLNLMYGASVVTSVSKVGDRAIIRLEVSAIDNSYALNGEEILKDSANLLAGMLLKPNMKNSLFDEKTFELQRDYLIDTIEAEINNKRKYAKTKTISIMFEGEAYGADSYGTIESAKAITLKEVSDAYFRIIDKANIEIIQVGMGDSEISKEVFKKAFENIKRHPATLPETKISDFNGEVKNVTERFDVTQSKLCLGFKVNLTPDSELMNPMRLAIAILGGTPTSKLFTNVREKKSLCYYCSAGYDSKKGYVLIDSGVEHDKITDAKDAILEQIDAVANGDFTDTDMEFAFLYLKNALNTVSESTYSVSIYYFMQSLMGFNNTPEKEIEEISKVQREDIIKAIKLLKLNTVYLLTDKEK